MNQVNQVNQEKSEHDEVDGMKPNGLDWITVTKAFAILVLSFHICTVFWLC